MQTHLNIYATENKNKNGKYIQLPPTNSYKENNRYKKCKQTRRKTTLSILEEYGLDIDYKNIDQRNDEIPLVWSNDKMAIKAPIEIKLPNNSPYAPSEAVNFASSIQVESSYENT